MQGAVPDTSQKTPEVLMRDTQQSSLVSPASRALATHPLASQIPQPSVQHWPKPSTPEIPLLHVIPDGAGVVGTGVVGAGVVGGGVVGAGCVVGAGVVGAGVTGAGVGGTGVVGGSIVGAGVVGDGVVGAGVVGAGVVGAGVTGAGVGGVDTDVLKPATEFCMK